MNSLRFKVGLYLVMALMVAAVVFTIAMVHGSRQELLRQATEHSSHLVAVMIRSTRFAMLKNDPAQLDKIIADVGGLPDIDRVRILSKEGIITHSSLADEVGRHIDQEAEACLACHSDPKAMQEAPDVGRPRFFRSEDGRHLMGSTAVIENEPSCRNAACHAHPAEQPVLGVLDVVYPLDSIQAAIRKNTSEIIGLALGFVLLAAVLVSLLVQRIVYRPVKDLAAGAARLARGDLDHEIPVRSADEFGQLAETFNSMMQALRRSRAELEEWGRTLEQKVEEATRDLRIAQAEAARGEKLASVGLLAAGIAHELNNPLTGILTFSMLVREQLPDDSPAAEDLDLVIRETRRCAGIIRRLLDFAREKAPEREFVDLNRLIEDNIQLIRQSAQVADIEIVTDMDAGLPPVWIDKELMEQVVMNMLVNAQHAIGKGGRISVQTRVLEASGKNEDSVAGEGTGRRVVEIRFADTGCGIAADDLERIFDPFFTTKEVGKGTGLGLSISHGTVEAHGGWIEVDSTPGEGTEFRIYLPLHDGAPGGGKEES